LNRRNLARSFPTCSYREFACTKAFLLAAEYLGGSTQAIANSHAQSLFCLQQSISEDLPTQGPTSTVSTYPVLLALVTYIAFSLL